MGFNQARDIKIKTGKQQCLYKTLFGTTVMLGDRIKKAAINQIFNCEKVLNFKKFLFDANDD